MLPAFVFTFWMVNFASFSSFQFTFSLFFTFFLTHLVSRCTSFRFMIWSCCHRKADRFLFSLLYCHHRRVLCHHYHAFTFVSLLSSAVSCYAKKRWADADWRKWKNEKKVKKPLLRLFRIIFAKNFIFSCCPFSTFFTRSHTLSWGIFFFSPFHFRVFLSSHV